MADGSEGHGHVGDAAVARERDELAVGGVEFRGLLERALRHRGTDPLGLCEERRRGLLQLVAVLRGGLRLPTARRLHASCLHNSPRFWAFCPSIRVAFRLYDR